MSFGDFPVDVGPVYEGERIRAKEMYVELGGPKIEKHFELVKVRPEKDIKDDQVTVIGPDLKDMKTGESYPIGILLEVGGPELEEDLEAVFERRIHEFTNYIQGVMHLNQRYTNWMRISIKSYEKGFNSLKFLGIALIRLFKAELGIIKKAQATIYTDVNKIKDAHDMAMKTYGKRDER
ncbi:MAG TPA: acetyl-CoA decarbonylase/synthase complex subunit beta, partial [Candidatus Lokiarchaeia archaeon]